MKGPYKEEVAIHFGPESCVVAREGKGEALTGVPFDKEMRRRGYQLTRYADEWVTTCKSAAEVRVALATAKRILESLGVQINPRKTRIVHVRHGFEFLGYKIKQGRRPLRLPADKIVSSAQSGALYAYPREKSIRHFKDQIRKRTRRKAPLSTEALTQQLNPVVRGWGHYYKRARVRRRDPDLHRADHSGTG